MLRSRGGSHRGSAPRDSGLPGSPLARGAALAATAQIAAGSSFVAVAALADYPIAGGQGARYGVAAVALAVIARGRARMPSGTDWLRLAAISLLGLAVFNALIIIAVDDSDPAAVGVIVGCVPVLLAILAPLQVRQRPRPSVIATAVVVAIGAALVQWTGGATSTKAILLATGALVCEAAFTLLAVPLLTTIGAYGVTVWACALSVPMLGGWALLVDGADAYRMPTTGEFLALTWLVVGVTLIAILSWFTAVHLLGAGLAGFFNGLMPVAAMAIGAGTGTVALTPLRVVGTLIVAAGITLGMRASRPQPPKRYPTPRS
ncbi:MAG: DMT family transporter [Thermoleophilia bacterium]